MLWPTLNDSALAEKFHQNPITGDVIDSMSNVDEVDLVLQKGGPRVKLFYGKVER